MELPTLMIFAVAYYQVVVEVKKPKSFAVKLPQKKKNLHDPNDLPTVFPIHHAMCHSHFINK